MGDLPFSVFTTRRRRLRLGPHFPGGKSVRAVPGALVRREADNSKGCMEYSAGPGCAVGAEASRLGPEIEADDVPAFRVQAREASAGRQRVEDIVELGQEIAPGFDLGPPIPPED